MQSKNEKRRKIENFMRGSSRFLLGCSQSCQQGVSECPSILFELFVFSPVCCSVHNQFVTQSKPVWRFIRAGWRSTRHPQISKRVSLDVWRPWPPCPSVLSGKCGFQPQTNPLERYLEVL